MYAGLPYRSLWTFVQRIKNVLLRWCLFTFVGDLLMIYALHVHEMPWKNRDDIDHKSMACIVSTISQCAFVFVFCTDVVYWKHFYLLRKRTKLVAIACGLAGCALLFAANVKQLGSGQRKDMKRVDPSAIAAYVIRIYVQRSLYKYYTLGKHVYK